MGVNLQSSCGGWVSRTFDGARSVPNSRSTRYHDKPRHLGELPVWQDGMIFVQAAHEKACHKSIVSRCFNRASRVSRLT